MRATQNKGYGMLDKLAKEIASEVIAKKKDPEYKVFLNKNECISKLSIIMDLPGDVVARKMDAKINDYLKNSHMFR